MIIDSARSFAVPCGLGLLVLTMANAAAASATVEILFASAPTGRIVVLGDSLAVSPSRAESFPAHLQKRLDEAGLPWRVTNAGVSGDVTSGGLRRFDAALTSDTRILILELGANDGLRGVDVSTVEKNLATMIERAQSRGVRVVLCGMIVPPRFGWNYAVAFQGLFPRLAKKYDVPLVPFLLEGVALQPEFNTRDGIHPNAAGAARIAGTVWRFLEPLVREHASDVAGLDRDRGVALISTERPRSPNFAGSSDENAGQQSA